MLQFKATDEQVQDIAINAIKASKPMGMGYAHYNANQEFKREQIKLDKDSTNPGVFLDYVGGRMVKLQIWHKGDDVWETHSGEAQFDYQSWASKYHTYLELVQSVGGVLILGLNEKPG